MLEDLQLLAEEYEHDDDLCNKVLGIKHVYEMRFNKAWKTYEKVVEEYYAWKPREVNFDEEPEAGKAYEWKHGAVIFVKDKL